MLKYIYLKQKLVVIIMIRIAVVDDEKIICEHIVKLLKKYENKHNVAFEIVAFNSGETLLADINELSPFDLILLDIELRAINGIDVGCHIRNIENDQTCQIIYISSKTEYAIELFQIRPFHFLIKPIDENKLSNCLDDYIKCFSNKIYFKFVTKKIRRHIPVEDIMYFESYGRKMIIHCNNDISYEYYGKMTDLLDDERLTKFIMIHKSFFVNTFYILSYSYEEMTIVGEKVLAISKANRKEVRRKILEHSTK